jgi:predicted MFS family arabinose efflux permease
VVWFSTATTPTGLILARALLGLGSSCYLMGPLALYAHRFPPERFATLAGIQLGIGTTGTLIATAPLAMSAAAVGWRTTFLFVGGGVLLVGALLALVVPSDRTARKAANQERLGESIAGVLKAMRTPDIGRLFLMHLATYSSFVLILGLWGGPYLTHIYGYSLTERGDLLFLAAAGQVAGQFLWGPTERLLRSHKVPVLAGSWLTVVALAVPAVLGKLPVGGLMAWLVVFGVITAYTPVLIAHGKTLFPPELVGRGMTLLNIGTMGGAFVSQAVTGIIINQFPANGGAYPLLAYQLIFGLQAVALLLATLAYLRARDDRTVAA